ncbi:MAG: hypothetical protein JW881_17775 [Spirochaetales bacterium]|nr:hypothetical protein [Spirochaetales bacterium]
MRAWYSPSNPYWSIDEDGNGSQDNVNPHPEWGFGGSAEWNSTLAPDGVWGMEEDNGGVCYRFGIPLEDDGGHYDPLAITAGGGTVFHPYTPNFTSKKVNEVPNGYKAIHTSYSSGIDCVTIIQRSAGYTGNRYDEITDLAEDRQEWGEAWASLEHVDSVEAACWPIPVDGSLLVPGDILVIHGESYGVPWGHCGIVQRIIYGDDRSVDRSQVRILDSSGMVMRVRLDLRWSSMLSMGGVTVWSIGRLQQQ